ncbi:MAG: B12-binding domain-containing radical SAM protein [Candidatus Nitrospinota bacterium M3_3B_026]
MRLALINPLSGHFHYDAMSMPPLGLLAIAGFSRQSGHDVIFIDRNAKYYHGLSDIPEETRLTALNEWTRRRLAAFSPHIAGVTLMTCQMKDARLTVGLIRESLGGDVTVVMGGYHPTCEPVSIFKDIPETDIAVRGFGEEAMGDLLGGAPWDKIPGIAFRADKRTTGDENPAVVLTPERPVNWKRLSWPDVARDLMDTEYYFKAGRGIVGFYFNHLTSIMTARGCNKSCDFCASKIMEPRLAFQSAPDVLARVERLILDYGLTGLFFYDINFPVWKTRTREVLDAFISSGVNKDVKWIACASADDLPYDLLPKMREAGCVGLNFGFESASQKVLDTLNKRTPAHKNQEAVDALEANGIRPISAFIMGVPGETEEDIHLTFDFIRRNRLFSGLNVLLPLPGTRINKRLVAEGRLDPSGPDYWGMISDTNAPLSPNRVFSDVPYERFIELYRYGITEICAPNNSLVYIDQPEESASSQDQRCSAR